MKKVILIAELMEYLSSKLEHVTASGMEDRSSDYVEGYIDALQYLLELVRNRW